MRFFAVSPCPYVAATDEDVYRSGWRCPTLLKAMYLMLHLDREAGNKILKCKARDCPNYFRAPPQSKRKYCPHPEDPSKPSKCGSRVTSQRSRERRQS
jgi:hypothetical protein